MGNGTLTLSAISGEGGSNPNSYTGLTSVLAGTLAYGSNDVIYHGDLLVNGGTVSLGAYHDSVGAVPLPAARLTAPLACYAPAASPFPVDHQRHPLRRAPTDCRRPRAARSSSPAPTPSPGQRASASGTLQYANLAAANASSATTVSGGTLLA